MPLNYGFINNAVECAFLISFSCVSCVVQHRLPHQDPWFCCAPALFSPRWHSVFEARLPLAPGLFGAHRGFDSPAAPSNCLPWWTSRAVTLAGQRSVASHCVPSHYCYDCWEEKTIWPGCSSMWEIKRLNKSSKCEPGVVLYLPRVLLESKESGFCGGVVEGWGEGVDWSAE